MIFTNMLAKCAFLIPTNKQTYFEPVRQGAQQLDFNGQADERSHATVGDGGCELNAHSALCIINLRGLRGKKEEKRIFKKFENEFTCHF